LNDKTVNFCYTLPDVFGGIGLTPESWRKFKFGTSFHYTCN